MKNNYSLDINEAIKFAGIDIEKINNNLQEKLKLCFTMEINQPFKIKSEGKVISEISEFYLLYGLKCTLTFKIDVKEIKIDLFPTDSKIYEGCTIKFDKALNPYEIEYLTKWKNSSDIDIIIHLYGNIIYDNTTCKIAILNSKIKNIKMSLNDWNKKILEPSDLTLEFPKLFELNESDELLDLINCIPDDIKEIVRLIVGVELDLKSAIRSLRSHRNDERYNDIISILRLHLDSLKDKLLEKDVVSSLAQEIFIDTNIIKDISNTSSGKKDAAEEIIKDIQKLIQQIFSICSKAAHTKNRPTLGNTNFEMYSGIEELEFLLTSLLSIKSYVLKRIKHSIS